MKTTYLSKNNRVQRRNLFIGCAVLLLASILFFTGFFSTTFYSSMVFLTSGKKVTDQTASSFFAIFSSKQKLEKENADLRAQLVEAKISVADRHEIEEENKRLKASLNLKADTKRIYANVLSKPPFAPFDIITIDQGQEQGVTLGQYAMIGSIFLGTVTEVSKDTSRVTLLSSPDQKINTFIGDISDRTLPATFSGKGGGNFEASVPQGSVVNEGDSVFAVVDSDTLYVGNVSKVFRNTDNTFMTLLLNFPINLYELSHVEIVSK